MTTPAHERSCVTHGPGIRALVALTKPRVVAANAAMIVVGAAAAGTLEATRLTAALLGGAALIASATAANQWYERDVDARMERTARRPLATGALPPTAALVLSGALLSLGLAVLLRWTHAGGVRWAATGWVLYSLIYTPWKRWGPGSLHAGALSGAVTPLLGAYALTPTPGPLPWAIALYILMWQYPHFLAIGIRRRSEYALSGLSVFTMHHSDTVHVLMARCAVTLLVLAGPWVTTAGAVALWVVSCLPLVNAAFRPARHRLDAWAHELFVASLWAIVLLSCGVLALWGAGALPGTASQ